MRIVELTILFENKDWNKALITFKSDNWPDKDYTEVERTYRVSSRNKYFDSNMGGTSLFGDCLDGVDNGVRLDHYKWRVERIEIIS